MGNKTFDAILRGENWECVTDSEGVVNRLNIQLSLKEALELIAGAVKIEKSRYGWDVYSVRKNKRVSVYFRFGNVSVKKNDNIEDFIKSNWK